MFGDDAISFGRGFRRCATDIAHCREKRKHKSDIVALGGGAGGNSSEAIIVSTFFPGRAVLYQSHKSCASCTFTHDREIPNAKEEKC